jgi:3-isopropylmalate dehydrogenase
LKQVALAELVLGAVTSALNSGARTPDLGGTLSTSAMGDAVLAGL